MEEPTTSRIVNGLSSTKIKERQGSLDELTSILKYQPFALPTKPLQLIYETIITQLDLELRKYNELLFPDSDKINISSSSKISLAEERLTSISYVLRLLIEKTIERIKLKTLNFLLNAIPALMISEENKKLVSAISGNMSFALKILVSSELFKLKTLETTWIDITDKITTFLNQQLDYQNSSDRVSTNFLLTLITLINIDNTGIYLVSKNIISVIIRFLKNKQSSKTYTRLLLNISNTIILKTNCSDIYSVLMLIKECLRYLLFFGDSNDESIRIEIFSFDYFAAELIANNLPKMVGVEYQRSSSNFDTTDDLFCQELYEYINLRLMRYQPSLLNSNSFSFKTSLVEGDSWVESNEYVISQEKNHVQWLQLLSLTDLIVAYYNIASKGETNLLSFKRNKTENGFNTLLKKYETIELFLNNCINNKDFTHIQLIGFQLCFVYLSYYNINKEDATILKETIFQTFENDHLGDWNTIALIPLISQKDFALTTDDIIRIFKVCLPRIKYSDKCKIACVLLTYSIRFSNELVSDVKFKNEIHDMYEFSEINGPNEPCNESFNFWMHLHSFSQNTTLSNSRTSEECILRWLLLKWNSLKHLSKEQDMLNIFITWICGEDISVFNNFQSPFVQSKRDSWHQRCHSWRKQKEERTFLLQRRTNSKTINKERFYIKVSKSQLQEDQVNDLLIKVYDYTREIEIIDIKRKLRWLFETLMITDKLANNPSFMEFTTYYRRYFTLTLNSISLNKRSNHYLFLQEISRMTIFNIPVLLPDIINSDIILKYSSGESIDSSSKGTGTDEFDNSSSFEEYPKHTVNYILEEDTLLAASINSILCIFGYSNPSRCLRFLLEIIPKCSQKSLVAGVKSICKWLEQIKEDLKSISDSDLENFIQYIAGKLLTTRYNTSNKTILVLSKFLNATRSKWMENPGSSLHVDANDILEWLISRCEEAMFSGEYAIKALSNLLLHLLMYHDLSRDTIKGGKQRIFSTYMMTLNRLPDYGIFFDIEDLTKYITMLSYKNQNILFSEVVSLFDTPQKTIESSAFYILVLKHLSTTSYSILVNVLKNFLEFSHFQHAKTYIDSGLALIVEDLQVDNKRSLFYYCKVDILHYWFKLLKGGVLNYDSWQLSLFDFHNVNEFYREYQIEIAAFYYAFGIKANKLLENLFSKDTKEETALLVKCYPLSVPLAFLEEGIHNDIYNLIKEAPKTVDVSRENYNLITLKYILRLTDLGSVSDTVHHLKSLNKTDKIVEKMYSSSILPSRYHYPLTIKIDEGLSLIKSVYENRLLYFEEFQLLILWILKDLDESISLFDKLRCVREIKALIIMNQTALEHTELIEKIIRYLARHSVLDLLHFEITSLFSTLLKYFFSFTNISNKTLIYIFFYLLVRKDINHKPVNSDLLTTLIKFADVNTTEGNLWKYCLNVLNDLNLPDELFQFCAIFSTEHCTSLTNSLFSLLLRHATKPPQLQLQETVLLNCYRNILKYPVFEDYSTKQYKLWIVQIISQIPDQIVEENHRNQDYCPLLSVKSCNDSFQQIISTISNYFHDEAHIENISEEFLYNTIWGHFIQVYESNPTTRILSEEQYNQLSGQICRIHSNAFSYLVNSEPSFHDMNVFLSDFYLNKIDNFTMWLSYLSSATLLALDLEFPYAKFLYPLCQTSQKFFSKIIVDLVLLLVSSNPRDSLVWIPKLFNQLGSLLFCVDAEYKIDLFLKLFQKIRTRARKHEATFYKVYRKIDLDSVYSTAIKIKKTYLGYMLFEEVNMERESKEYSILQEIYGSLNNIDLLAGLPAATTLLNATNILNQSDSNRWKNFIFNNAQFDAAFKDTSSNNYNLIQSAEKNGFYGLCKSISSNIEQYSDVYNWCIQLGDWNLPCPKDINNKTHAIYFALKQISINSVTIDDILEQSVLTVVDNYGNFVDRDEWVLTISEIYGFMKMSKSLDTKNELLELLKGQYISDEKKLKVLSYSNYKTFLEARYQFARILSENNFVRTKIDQVTLDMLSFLKLFDYGRLSVAMGDAQDSLRNAYRLESMTNTMISKLNIDTWENYSIMYANKFTSASALRMANDWKTSTTILKDLLNYNTNMSAVDNSSLLLFNYIEIPQEQLRAHLIEWMSESKLMSSSEIYEKYVSNMMVTTRNHEVRAVIFNTVANFLSDQVQKLNKDGKIEEYEVRCGEGSNDVKTLLSIYQSSSIPDDERKEAKRQYSKMKLQLERDENILKELLDQREQYVWKSLYFYLQVLLFSNKYDNDVIDKFCGLWFEFDKHDNINDLLQKEITLIPSWKFLPWVNQIASKLTNENDSFQKVLHITMKRLVFKLPYDSLYSLMSILLYKKYTIESETLISQKVQCVDKILKELQTFQEGQYYRTYIQPIRSFSEECVELAVLKFDSRTKHINLQNQKIGHYWLNEIAKQKIPLPTRHFTITSSMDGKKPRPYITKVEKTIEITTTGISLPKIVTCHISDGSQSKILLKGSNDDLRQDAIMEQVFEQVNNILRGNEDLLKHNLGIRTYKVIPLGPKAGLIEYVANSVSLHQILTCLHEKDTIMFNEARKLMRSVQNKSDSERIRTYKKLTKEIKPQLRNFFFNSFPDPQQWFKAKERYTKGIAATSIVGHILGLGDRHLNNILLDSTSGEPIHIDLGIAFDQGRLLPIPELVPFRLTRDIIDGFGITGVDGIFRQNCERVYGVLRENSSKVLHVLNILRWDPLYSWIMSPVQRHKHLMQEDTTDISNVNTSAMEIPRRNNGNNRTDNNMITSRRQNDNQESYRAIKGVEEKLMGNGTGIEATVQELIQEATDPANLAVIYMGWSPFY